LYEGKIIRIYVYVILQDVVTVQEQQERRSDTHAKMHFVAGVHLNLSLAPLPYYFSLKALSSHSE
jgi:hypothetical protein